MNLATEFYYLVFLASIFGLALFFFLRVIVMLKRRRLWAGCRNTGYFLLFLLLLITSSLIASNFLSYHRLTHERTIASVQIKQLKQQQYQVELIFQENCKKTAYVLDGDEWQIDARIIKWHSWANLLGIDSQYQLDRISGRYHDIEQQRGHFPSVFALEDKHDYDLWVLKRKYQWLPWLDAQYGQSVFLPMENAITYQLYMTQNGMIARKNTVTELECKAAVN